MKMGNLYYLLIFVTIALASGKHHKKAHHQPHAHHETRNQYSLTPWNNGIIPDLNTVSQQKTCNMQCLEGGSWVMDLKSERYKFAYDTASNTFSILDYYRNGAVVFTRNVNGYVYLNLTNGWNMFVRNDDGFAVVPATAMINPTNLYSLNATTQARALQAVSEALVRIIPAIPLEVEDIFNGGNTLDLNLMVRAIESGDIPEYLASDEYFDHNLKVALYQHVATYAGDVLYQLQLNQIPFNGDSSDIVRTLLHRLPPIFADAVADMVTLLSGTSTGYLDSTLLYTQLFSLLELIPGAGQIPWITTGADRSWTITIRSNVNNTVYDTDYYITAPGNVYNGAGRIIDTMETTQQGYVLGIPVYNANQLVSSFTQYKNSVGLVAPFSAIASYFGQAFGLGGIVEPFANLASNVEAAGWNIFNNFLGGNFIGISTGSHHNQNHYFG